MQLFSYILLMLFLCESGIPFSTHKSNLFKGFAGHLKAGLSGLKCSRLKDEPYWGLSITGE